MSEIGVRSSIVVSATKYFSKFGFYKTTMDEIARNIHKAKGVLYYYFKSKEELFNEVLEHELSAVKVKLAQIVNSDENSLVIFKEYFLARLKLLHKAVNYHETLKADFFEKYHFVKNVRDDFDKFERDQLTFILEKGRKDGSLEIKNINSTVNITMLLLNGIEIPLFLQNKYPEFENNIEDLAILIMNSLKA